MARAKASEPRRGKSGAAEDLIHGIAKLRELSAQIEDLSRDGFPYREAGRARTELSLRETIRRLFGEKSPEYHAHKHHKLRVGSRAESAQSITLIKQLITVLETQKADLLGVKSPVTSQPGNPTPERPALTSVPLTSSPDFPPKQSEPSAMPLAPVNKINPPAIPSLSMTTTHTIPAQTTPVIMTSPTHEDSLSGPPPLAASSESISNASPSQPSDSSPSNPAEAQTIVSASVGDNAPAPDSMAPAHGSPTNFIQGASTPAMPTAAPESTLSQATLSPVPRLHDLSDCKPALQTEPPVSSTPSDPVKTSVNTASGAMTPQSNGRSALSSNHSREKEFPRPSFPASNPAQPLESSVTLSEAAADRIISADIGHTESGTLDLLRRVCTRFHLVARQLRLRKEYRPTLEISDEYDLQDLFYALLRLQFDEVGTEEWTPGYTDGARRTSYLLDWDRTIVVVKQTRSGLTTKDLADQVKSDAAHYAARPNGSTLLCFIYDPDGRVGNPRGLEADLTTVSDAYTVEVIVAPK